MVLYHQNRIEESYIPMLRARFKAYDNGTKSPQNTSASDTTLSALRDPLFDGDLNVTSTLEKHTRIVNASYDLRRTRKTEEILYSSPSATPRSKSLWLDICLLARLRVALQKFKEIAVTLPSFEQVTIILVPCPRAPANPSQRPLSCFMCNRFIQSLGRFTTRGCHGHLFKPWTVPSVNGLLPGHADWTAKALILVQ